MLQLDSRTCKGDSPHTSYLSCSRSPHQSGRSEGWSCRQIAQSPMAEKRLTPLRILTPSRKKSERNSWLPGLPGRSSRLLRASWYYVSCLFELRSASNLEFFSEFHLILSIPPEFSLIMSVHAEPIPLDHRWLRHSFRFPWGFLRLCLLKHQNFELRYCLWLGNRMQD